MPEQAPVCLLPNRSQAPALQAGKIFQQAVPRATDLPTAQAALNILAQIVNMIMLPNLAPFNNNLAPTNFLATGGGGTNTIRQGGGFNTKGSDGSDADSHQWDQTTKIYENIKVYNPDDEDQKVFVKQITRLDFKERITEKQFSWKEKGGGGGGGGEDTPQPESGDGGGGDE